MFSKSCKYGLRATIYLSHQPHQDFISLSHIADELNIPFHFLTKVMQKLKKAGIIESRRGSVGGIRLAEPERNISLFSIINAIKEKDDLLESCFLGFPRCNLESPCPYHEQWREMTESINNVLKNIHLNSFKKSTAENFINKKEKV